MTSSKHHLSSLLPLELVEEIFYKVPIKSLVRFKTVCKEWYALFNDKRFIYKHLDLSQEEQFMLVDELYHKSIQIFNPETNALLRLPTPDVLHNQFLAKSIHCDGLLLFRCTEIGTFGNDTIRKLAVWNPMMSRVRWIEPSNSYTDSDIFGFGYDNVSRDSYKILRIDKGELSSEIEIYEFNSKLWRSVDATLKKSALGQSVSMNGNMYWIAEKKMVNSQTEFSIQSFDFSTETFKPVCCAPEGTECSRRYDHRVLLSGFGGDRLSLLHQYKVVKMEVWVTSKLSDGVVSWTKCFNVTRGPSYILSSIFHSSWTYFVHKTNKVMLLCDEYDQGQWSNYTNVYEICEDGIKKQVVMRGQKRWVDSPCIVYVPSLVPVSCLEELGSGKQAGAVESKPKSMF